MSKERLEQLQSINYEDWQRDHGRMRVVKLYSHLPKELILSVNSRFLDCKELARMARIPYKLRQSHA